MLLINGCEVAATQSKVEKPVIKKVTRKGKDKVAKATKEGD